MEISGAVVILDDDAEAGYSGSGEEAVSAVFKPLQSPPQINIQTEDKELQLDDLDLDPNTVLMIQERTITKIDKNKEHTHRAVVYSKGLFMKVYNSVSLLGNISI